MSECFTLEDYRLSPAVCPAVGSQVPAKQPGKVWSRQVASDLVALSEAAGIMLGGLLPPIIYASAGVLQPAWPTIIQSALIAGLIYRMSLASAAAAQSTALPRPSEAQTNPLGLSGTISLPHHLPGS